MPGRHDGPWKDTRVVSGQRVLVVDGLLETEQVLRTVLEPRGLTVDRIRGDSTESSPHDLPRPSVVVIHEDDARARSNGSNDWNEVPRVVIGSAEFSGRQTSTHDRHYLTKPFQYRELIQAIEHLLEEPPQPQ
jgi:hypothetical protein